MRSNEMKWERVFSYLRGRKGERESLSEMQLMGEKSFLMSYQFLHPNIFHRTFVTSFRIGFSTWHPMSSTFYLFVCIGSSHPRDTYVFVCFFFSSKTVYTNTKNGVCNIFALLLHYHFITLFLRTRQVLACAFLRLCSFIYIFMLCVCVFRRKLWFGTDLIFNRKQVNISISGNASNLVRFLSCSRAPIKLKMTKMQQGKKRIFECISTERRTRKSMCHFVKCNTVFHAKHIFFFTTISTHFQYCAIYIFIYINSMASIH